MRAPPPQAAIKGLGNEVRLSTARLRREWEAAVEAAAVRHAEQMAEGRSREERLKAMRCAARARVCVCVFVRVLGGRGLPLPHS